MKYLLATIALFGLTAAAAQDTAPAGDCGGDDCNETPGGVPFIPGGDQFIPGGDQFELSDELAVRLREALQHSGLAAANADEAIEQWLPDALRRAIPGGDQFVTELSLADQINLALGQLIPGGDQFIPGGDQFEPGASLQTALARALGAQIPGGDQFIPGGDQFIPGGDSFIPGGDQFIPGGDQFEPTVAASTGNLPAVASNSMPASASDRVIVNVGDGVDRNPPDDGESPIAEADGLTVDLSTVNELDVEAARANACDWTGRWSSTFGTLALIQEGGRVYGDYGVLGFIEGVVEPGCRLRGTFDNRRQRIRGSYLFERDGESFTGTWDRDDGLVTDGTWKGERRSTERPELKAEELWSKRCLWTGTWRTVVGDMRLIQEDSRVTGEIGDHFKLSGTTDTACEGARDVRLQATVTDLRDASEHRLDITLSDQFYAGSFSLPAANQGRSSVFRGSRRTRDTPELRLAQRQPGAIPDAVPAAADNGNDPNGSNPQSPGPLRFSVNLGHLCTQAISQSAGSEEYLYGIVWVRARVMGRDREHVIAPVGGFLNLNGDQERAWEIDLREERRGGLGNRARTNTCAAFTGGGLGIGRSSDAAVTVEFEIDPADYGYRNHERFLADSRNRIRVQYRLDMKQLGIYSGEWEDKGEIGSYAMTIAMSDASVCGTCKVTDWQQRPRMAPTGTGILSNVSNSDGFRGFIAFDVQRTDSR